MKIAELMKNAKSWRESPSRRDTLATLAALAGGRECDTWVEPTAIIDLHDNKAKREIILKYPRVDPIEHHNANNIILYIIYYN